MPATRAIREVFTWDKEVLRYRRAGRFVSERAVKLGVRRVMRASQAELRAIADQMASGEISLSEFQSRMASELKNLHVSGAMAGQGGPANMTANDYLRVGRKLRNEYRFLNRFTQAIADGKLDRRSIRSRTEMYVLGMNGSYEDGKRASAIASGFDQERNLLGSHEHNCSTRDRLGCPELTKLGWVQIGTLVAVGNRQCLSRCRCSLSFRRSKLTL